MQQSISLIDAPAVEPVTLDEARSWLRLPEEEDNTLISGLITAARTYFEEHDDRRLVRQRWKITRDRFECDPYYDDKDDDPYIELPLRPLIELESITYVDNDGVRQTLNRFDYEIDYAFRARIRPTYGNYWPATRDVFNAVEITALIGYADSDGGYSTAVAPSWSTLTRVAAKTKTGFRVYFSVAAPAGATLYYLAGGITATPSVSQGATYFDVDFGPKAFSDTTYSLTVSPQWSTTHNVTLKTTTGFTVSFGTAAPTSATLHYSAFNGVPAGLMIDKDVAIAQGATSASITFPDQEPVITAVVPEHLKKALLLLVGHFYENREQTQAVPNMIQLPMGYNALVGAHRTFHV